MSIAITDEDIEEIVSDVFVAIWKNSSNLLKTTEIKPYLVGTAKNIIRNKYRDTKLNFSISDYEENVIDICNIEEITEQKEQDKIIQGTLQKLKYEEYKIFIMFYYESKIPDKFISSNFYSSSIKGYKDANLPDEYKIHDYVFEYRTENGGEIFIAICKDEKPLRDYYFEFKGEKSQIGNTELEISQYNNKYMATFEFNNINYDIETNDITENELLELLQSILTENTNKNTSVEDEDINVNEQSNENINTGYPDYYAGKYIDNNGNNVVLLCENNETNRRTICSLLGITENRTTFKTAKYSYNYLTNLQNKISKKVIDK